MVLLLLLVSRTDQTANKRFQHGRQRIGRGEMESDQVRKALGERIRVDSAETEDFRKELAQRVRQ